MYYIMMYILSSPVKDILPFQTTGITTLVPQSCHEECQSYVDNVLEGGINMVSA